MMCIFFLMKNKRTELCARQSGSSVRCSNSCSFHKWSFPFFFWYSDFQVGTTRRSRNITVQFARDSFTGHFLGVRTTRSWFLNTSTICQSHWGILLYVCLMLLQSSCLHKKISTRNYKINTSKMSRTALGLIQPPIQWVLGARSPG
jgi:hypothetical protein